MTASMRTNRPLILASLLLAAFAINLDTTIVNIALPTLVRELHASPASLASGARASVGAALAGAERVAAGGHAEAVAQPTA
jgi:MFS family permease